MGDGIVPGAMTGKYLRDREMKNRTALGIWVLAVAIVRVISGAPQSEAESL